MQQFTQEQVEKNLRHAKWDFNQDLKLVKKLREQGEGLTIEEIDVLSRKENRIKWLEDLLEQFKLKPLPQAYQEAVA